jgi:uncharacterized RDD family membrane protein YckC
MAEGMPAVGPRYAGFWMRFWAWLLDAIILSIGIEFITNVIGIDSGGLFSDRFDVGATGFGLFAQWLYGAMMESSSTQGTLGKMALSLKVTDLEGERISFGRATGRHFAKYVSAVILLIGFMMAGWTAKKQALHDMMADTLVVRG